MRNACVCDPEHVDPEPPVLLTPPLPLTVSEGAASATWTCRVKGHPSPAVTWTHQGSVLLTDGHYTVTKDEDKNSLQILKPQKGDEGEYVCHVHNIAGTVTASCSLTVTASAEAEDSCSPQLNTSDNTVNQDPEGGKQTEPSDQGNEPRDPTGQQPAKRPNQKTCLPSSSTHPSETSPSTTSTTTTSICVSSTSSTLTSTFSSSSSSTSSSVPSSSSSISFTTTTTSRLSRASHTSRPVARSPSWSSGKPALGVDSIRVGSVRQRRDWFEQRASPSPDRARGSAQDVPASRRSAVSLDRMRQGGLRDRTGADDMVKKDGGKAPFSSVVTGDRTPVSDALKKDGKFPCINVVASDKTPPSVSSSTGDRISVSSTVKRDGRTPPCTSEETSDRILSSVSAANGDKTPGSNTVGKQKNTNSDDKISVLSRADIQRLAASETIDSAPSGTEDKDTVSHDVLTPAIYQLKTTPSSAEHAEKSLKVPSSMSPQPTTAESGSVVDTSDSRLSTANKANEDLNVHTDPTSEGLLGVSADTQRHRAVKRAAGSEGLRPLSPGRMDFRSVLRTRQTEGGKVQHDHSPNQPKTDFRSVLKKNTERDSGVRPRVPKDKTDIGKTTDRQQIDEDSDNGLSDKEKTDSVQTSERLVDDAGGGGGGCGQSEKEKTIDGQMRNRQNGSDVNHSMGTLSSGDAESEERKRQTLVSPTIPERPVNAKYDSDNAGIQESQAVTTPSIVITPSHTYIISPTADTTTETSTKPSPLPQPAEPINNLPEHSKQIYVTSAETTFKLSALAQESHPPSNIGRVDVGQGRRDDVSRIAEESGLAYEAPRVLQDLKDHRVSYGGQVVMRCEVTGRPEPEITWTLNSKKIKPSKFFQLSYQEPHAQLLVAEAYSEDEGEYTCTATNRVGTKSSSCYLTVEGVAQASVSREEGSDVTKESSSFPEPGDDKSGHDVIKQDVTETGNLGGEQTTNAEDCQKVPPSESKTGEERSSVLNAAGGSSQPINGCRGTDVIGSDGTSLAAEGGVVTDLHGSGQGPETQSPSSHPRVKFVSGRKFEDYYDCVREVGKGMFGKVYECVERGTGVVAAAKVMTVLGKKQRGVIRREVEVMNCLRHPTLLLLKDVFEAQRSMVLITEFVGGGELLERVCDEQYVLTENDCAHFLRQLCEGVSYMHGQGVVHLDLKPNNIMCVDPHSTTHIKIIDFGLARFYNPGDSLRVLHGTPEFIAPEVISYDDVSFSTDMWSVGVIAYILLSGLSPFLGDSDAETLANVTRGEYDFDDDSFDVISDDAKDFISRLLLKRKEKRMSADQCQRHAWLSQQNARQRTRRLNTENLRSFVAVRRKLMQIAAQAVVALRRMYKDVAGGSTPTGKAAGESTSS